MKESITVIELEEALKANATVVHLDVRSTEEFNSGHIPNAIHAPKDVLLSLVQSISKKSLIVTNCGKGGGRSIEAMQLLRENGWENSFWLEGGYKAYASFNSIKIFDSNFKKYDDWFENHPEEFRAELSAIKPFIGKDEIGLEVGAGSGRFMSALGCKFGVEPSLNFRQMGIQKGLSIVDGVAEKLPFQDKAFDYVLFVTSLCFVEDQNLAIAEANRVLKDSGKLIVAFLNKNSSLVKKYQNSSESSFFRFANFLSQDDVTLILKNNGFDEFEFNQTLLENTNENTLNVVNGNGLGAFIVVKANKQEKKL